MESAGNGGLLVGVIPGKVRQTVHNLAQKYRQTERRKAEKQEFEASCKRLSVNASWDDYLAAREQTLCSVREYFLFSFYEKTPEERDTYLTELRRNRFIHEIGDDESGYGSVPGNKILFNLLFGEFLCREWLNPTACTAQEFAAFVKKHGTVMVKPACDGCGRGIRLYSYAGDEDAFAQHGELAGAAVLVEEMPAQHEQLNRLNPHCLNTVRVTTYTDRDDVHVILSTIRTAKDDSVVDNFHAGGFCMAVNSKTGVIFSDGVDGQERVYVTHPVTGVTLRGFALPNWEKALDVVRRASRIMYELPKCRFLGWDIAFLANGEVAVLECNLRQGVETQIPHGRGMYHELEALKAKR